MTLRGSEAQAPERVAEPDLCALSRGQLVDAAASIAESIRGQLHYLAEGGVAFVGASGYGTVSSPFQVRRLKAGLDSGSTGIALFLAALARVKSDAELRQLSLEAVAPLRRALAGLLADPQRADRCKTRVGGFGGLGSYIYGLLTLGRLLEEPALQGEALEAASLITAERIAADDRMGVQTGSAGAILVLLALHRQLPAANSRGTRPLDVARECARHLLAARRSFEGRPRAWALAPGKPPLAGFCYGASGVCHALLRLYGETAEEELWEAAQEGLAFIRGLYSPQQRKWRDMRTSFQARYRPPRDNWREWWFAGRVEDLVPRSPAEPERDGFPDHWCHGSCGIALGKIASLDLDDSPTIRDEIAGMLEQLCRQARESDLAAGEVDDLCSGAMGRAEVLLGAHLRLGDESCLDGAHLLAARVWRRAQAQGRYLVSAARGSDCFAPSLFEGVAGIGYTFLRLAAPHELPSLLLLE